MNNKRRECVMCSKPIAFRVWARWDGGTEPPPARPYPDVWPTGDNERASIGSLLRDVGADGTIQNLVCADHIEHFEKGWAKMSGLPPGSVVVGHEPFEPPPPLPRGHYIKPETESWRDTDEIKANLHTGFGVLVDCRTWAPESAIGRPVTMFIPSKLILPMLDMLKKAAIEERQQTMTQAEKKREGNA
jgi:hypothetical protein